MNHPGKQGAAGNTDYPIWHPFTQMKDCEQQPLITIARAKGARLFAADGRYYYDTISSWWCNTLGHNHPRLNAALRRQLRQCAQVLFAGVTHAPAQRLAARLLPLVPAGLQKVFFSDNGSTAVEVALKMSLQYWRNVGQPRRTRFICLDHGYHGDTAGAMSVSGRSVFNEAFVPLMAESIRVPAPYCYRCPVNSAYPGCDMACCALLEQAITAQGPECCALVLEPLVLAAGGMIVYPAEYVRQAAALCRQAGIHLILDEVATGFGRTGTMFACEQSGVSPDFLCLSKAITAGYLPLGATVTTREIYQAFYDDYAAQKTFFHGHTYTANPLACAVAAEALRLYVAEDMLSGVARLAAVLQQEKEQFRGLPHVGDVRGLGMIAAIELVRDKDARTPFALAQRAGYRIYQAGLARHLLLRPLGNVIYFFLPYCLREKEISRLLRATAGIIRTARFD